MAEQAPTGEVKLNIIKEFWPRYPDSVTSAGWLIVGATNFGSELGRFDTFYDVIAEDAAASVPPLPVNRSAASVIHFGSGAYEHTFGLQVRVPEGHVVPDTYTRVNNPEFTL